MTSNLIIGMAIRAKASPYFTLQSTLLLVSTLCIASVFYVTRSKQGTSFSTETGFENRPSISQPDNAPSATNGAFGIQATQTVGDVVTKALAFYNTLDATQKTSLQLFFFKMKPLKLIRF